jgi:hypothetical protein
MDQTKVFRGYYSPFGFMHLDWSSTKEHLQILLNADDSNAQTLNAELLSFVAAPFQPARLARISSAGKQRSSDSRPIAIPSLIYSEILSTFSLGKFQFFGKVIKISNATPELLQLELSWGPGVQHPLRIFSSLPVTCLVRVGCVCPGTYACKKSSTC